MNELALPAADDAVDSDAQPLRNPVAVSLAALATVVLAFAVLPLDRAVVAALTGATLVVLSAIDLDRGIIPNRIVLPAAGVVLLAQVVLFSDRAGEWALAAILSACVLALLLGAALGWGVLGAVLLAFLCVFPVAFLVVLRGGLAARKTTLPFGPFLSLGALIMLFGPHLAG
jgi:prepilin signal peptidase PulO-like enzyme (type II secretory pathway)